MEIAEHILDLPESVLTLISKAADENKKDIGDDLPF